MRAPRIYCSDACRARNRVSVKRALSVPPGIGGPVGAVLRALGGGVGRHHPLVSERLTARMKEMRDVRHQVVGLGKCVGCGKRLNGFEPSSN